MIIVENFVVYTNPYPSVCSEQLSGTSLAEVPRADGTTLFCSFRVGSARMSPDGRVRVLTSIDGGHKWSPITPDWQRVAGDSVQISGGHLGASPSGVVILAAARMTTVLPDSERWVPAAAGIVDADCTVVRYFRGAWEAQTLLDARRHSDEWAIPCGPPLELSQGRWFLSMERHGKPQIAEWLRAYNAFSATSEDDGSTWQLGGPMMNDPERKVVYYDQHVARVPSGSLISVAWVHDVLNDRTLSARIGRSDDLGATWSEPVTTGIVGGPVSIATLPDGRLFGVYPRRSEPVGIRACISFDEGRTWETSEEFVIWDGVSRQIVGQHVTSRGSMRSDTPLWDSMWSWTFGLPCVVAHPDGTVGVAFYATDPGGASTVCYVRIEL